MIRMKNKFSMLGLTSLVLASTAVPAHAKLFSPWIQAKAANSGGTSDLFVYFDGPFAGGVEAGIEFLHIDVFGEALLMANDQYLLTANLGFDIDFGDSLWLELGLFTGPIAFHFPPQATDSGGFNWELLSASEKTQLEQAAMFAGFDDLSAVESEFDMFNDMEDDLSRWVFGWNLARVRVAAGVELLPILSVGFYGQLGYHMLITGEEVAAGAKNEAIDQISEENMIPDEIRELLRKASGAKPVDPQRLNGFNYNTGFFARLHF